MPVLKNKNMQTAKTISEIRQKLAAEKKLGKKIAFVPTMGALHRGHLALVERAREVADVVVVSLFVNKAQFNDLADYQKYPRVLEADLAQLEGCGVDYVFAPDDVEIYPEESFSVVSSAPANSAKISTANSNNLAFKIVVTKFVDCLCGAARAGHFDGVALVVSKLFNIIKPDIAIFGEKDFQQVLVIKKLVHDLNFNVEILTHEIVREKNGLALSSRNQRLSEALQEKASSIFRILSEIKSAVKNGEDIKNILQKKSAELLALGFEKIDYLEIRDEENLQLFYNENSAKNLRIFIAVYLGGVRLIDNLKI